MGGSALVTGGAGFIGSHLCARLASAGIEVHSASRRQLSPTSLFRHWQVDLSDADATLECVASARPDFIFHLASHVKGAPDLEQVLPTFRGNLQSTVNLLTAAARLGCHRFIMTSSFMEPAAESVGSTPTSPYAAAKWASAGYLRMFRALYGLPVVAARVFMVYGPGQQDDTKLVPYTIKSLLSGVPPRITSGRRLVDWVFVDDVVEGFLRLALRSDVEGLTVDLGSGSMIATSDLVAMICRLMGTDLRPQIGALPDRPLEPTGAADVAATHKLLGWAPGTSLEAGLLRTIASYRGA